MSAPATSEQQLHRTISKFLEADSAFDYYGKLDLLTNAMKALATSIDHESVIYAWPEIHSAEPTKESGTIHVLTNKLFVVATYKFKSLSTITFQPLSVSGLEVTPEYKKQLGDNLLINYTLKIQLADEAKPINIAARYGSTGFLTEKLQAAFTHLKQNLETTAQAS